jgi:hypothetical protein
MIYTQLIPYQKYLVCHPQITPEHFAPHGFSQDIKSLYVPHIKGFKPEIIWDSVQNAISKIFDDSEKVALINLHPMYHIYVDTTVQGLHKFVNDIATRFLRCSFLSFAGCNITDVVCGDVLFCGSISSRDFTSDSSDYSVPYELVEQVSRYYEYYFS